ncbi:uncharacterized protein N7498_009563 [Penicillium cinerascens]|uniref:BZIP domain-containing protein n=1 Tax=Penicillium cinerascens TaxID=70096 RepID=A0A9W9J5Q8_9EURO|nr:uncharacterized protein N7498_009563 [Penicillium cinerascens]KAJ5190578.1 hypothetical protein N7498_009563 [Penicillium cinerascens]
MAEVMAETKTTTPAPRKRGRPRTVTDDQEVPDRRRKQLRIAQQAYRRRKESTINNLQTRVQELEEGIEELSQSFLSFSSLLLEENILARHPRITSALQGITRQCVALAKQGCGDADEAASVEATSTPVVSRKKSAPQNIDLNLDSDFLESVPSLIPDDSLQFPFNSRQWPASRPRTPPYQDQAMLPFGLFLSTPSVPSISAGSAFPSPPATISPASFIKEEGWSLSQRIVRECCEIGYRLLVDTPNNARIEKIFGQPLTLSERNRLISAFYLAINDDIGDLIEPKTRALSPLYNKRENLSQDMLSRSSRTWQLVLNSGPDEWLDASGVQRLLQQRGIHIDGDSPYSSPRIDAPSAFNLSTFLRFLSLDCICVGPGPVFRKQAIEQALLLATSHNPWEFTPPKFIF